MSYSVRYKRGSRVERFSFEEDPRKDNCEICEQLNKKADKKTLQLHHWKYAFTLDEVRKNPELAKENTVTTCFYHHMLGDNLRCISEAKNEDFKVMIATMDFLTLDAFMQKIMQIYPEREENLRFNSETAKDLIEKIVIERIPIRKKEWQRQLLQELKL